MSEISKELLALLKLAQRKSAENLGVHRHHLKHLRLLRAINSDGFVQKHAVLKTVKMFLAVFVRGMNLFAQRNILTSMHRLLKTVSMQGLLV